MLSPELADNEVKREQLHYLVSCALADGVTLRSDVAGVTYTFEGGLGLAPRWTEQPLTLSEQRWVSACMLARTNYFGIPILISMRNPTSAVAALAASSEESDSFTLWEGGFFGNLFTENPSAYTCTGSRSRLETQDPILEKRICTEAVRSTNGYKVSACGFIVTGSCLHDASFTVGDEYYGEVIFTYLLPEAVVDAPE